MVRARRIARPIVHGDQIEELRKFFNPRTSLPVWACDKLIAIIEKADDDALQLIAKAEIHFASRCATLEITRRATLARRP